MTIILTTTERQALVDRFRPAREILRPRKCDMGRGCWVRDGAVACDSRSPPHCTGCGGAVETQGNERAHGIILARLCREGS